MRPMTISNQVQLPNVGTVEVYKAPGLKNWRMLILGVAITVLGSIQAADLVNVVPPKYVGIVMTAIGLAMTILRLFTSGPAGSDVAVKVIDSEADDDLEHLP